jgi:hypothetical protein
MFMPFLMAVCSSALAKLEIMSSAASASMKSQLSRIKIAAMEEVPELAENSAFRTCESTLVRIAGKTGESRRRRLATDIIDQNKNGDCA